MKLSNNLILKLSIITLLFVNCTESNTSDDDMSSMGCENIDIPFFLEGNEWNYKITTFGSESGEIKLSIGTCNSDGHLVERTVLNYSNNETSTNTDLWKQEDGFIITDSDNNNDYFAKIYKKNAQLGDIWTHEKADGETAIHEIISIDSTITVPAGTFTCKVIKYTATDIFNESFVFWDDALGNIKEDAGFLTLELLSYSN